MEDLIKELTAIGLSDKEAKVYIAVLEMGQAKVQEIGKKAGVNRATTYVILESLMSKGLISTFGEGKKSLFIAEGPHGLLNIIREQEEELHKRDAHLDELMPQLNSLYNLHPEKPTVRFYEGKEGLKAMQEDFLNSGVKEAVEFFSLADVNKTFTKEEATEFGNKRRAKKIKNKALFTDEGRTGEEEHGITVYKDDITKTIRISGIEYPFESDIIVYGNKVWMAFLKGDLSGVIVENKQIADTIRNIFELCYEGVAEMLAE